MTALPEPELLTEYRERAIPALRQAHGYRNANEIPRIQKVVVNASVGSQPDVKEALEISKTEIATITGQRPIETLAKKSIANFKLRQGQAIGAKVTLRGRTMYEFLDRLIKTALPRIRDFRGVSAKAFDGRGNYTLGVADQSIFPEIELDRIKRNIGFDITIVTTATTDAEAKTLLAELGMPFADKAKPAQPKPTNEEEAATQS